MNVATRFESLGFCVVQSSSFWEYSCVLEGSVASKALCQRLRFCGTLLVGCHPYTLTFRTYFLPLVFVQRF